MLGSAYAGGSLLLTVLFASLLNAASDSASERVVWEIDSNLQKAGGRMVHDFTQLQQQLEAAKPDSKVKPEDFLELVRLGRPAAVARLVQRASFVLQEQERQITLNGLDAVDKGTGIPCCHLAASTALGLLAGVPVAFTLQDEDHELEVAFGSFSLSLMSLLNEWTCLEFFSTHLTAAHADQLQEYRHRDRNQAANLNGDDFVFQSQGRKLLLLALAHELDKACIRYFDHVKLLTGNQLDNSDPSDSIPLLDLIATLQQQLWSLGDSLLQHAESADLQAAKQWLQRIAPWHPMLTAQRDEQDGGQGSAAARGQTGGGGAGGGGEFDAYAEEAWVTEARAAAWELMAPLVPLMTESLDAVLEEAKALVREAQLKLDEAKHKEQEGQLTADDRHRLEAEEGEMMNLSPEELRAKFGSNRNRGSDPQRQAKAKQKQEL